MPPVEQLGPGAVGAFVAVGAAAAPEAAAAAAAVVCWKGSLAPTVA